jgi:hypothetical protein
LTNRNAQPDADDGINVEIACYLAWLLGISQIELGILDRMDGASCIDNYYFPIIARWANGVERPLQIHCFVERWIQIGSHKLIQLYLF